MLPLFLATCLHTLRSIVSIPFPCVFPYDVLSVFEIVAPPLFLPRRYPASLCILSTPAPPLWYKHGYPLSLLDFYYCEGRLSTNNLSTFLSVIT